MESVRLRLVLADRFMLSKSQRTEGLKRSWVLLKPHHYTVSDFANYLLDVYDLHDVCPNGLLLSMDGFMLPPFESTTIFKDKDIIRVNKKQSTSLDTTKVICDGANTLGLEVVEKQPITAGVKLLADEELQKETGVYQSKPEDDELGRLEDTLLVNDRPDKNIVSKKRKTSKKLQTTMRKRNKRASIKEHSGAPGDAQNVNRVEKNQSFQQPSVFARNSVMKKKSYGQQESDKDKSSFADSDKTTNGMDIYAPSPKRSCQMQENGERNVVPPDLPDGNKKCSRSARRKKAKRQWLREQAKAGNKGPSQQKLVKTNNQKSFGVDSGKCAEDHNQLDNNEEDDAVPVVVRPGHIRFGPIGNGDTDQVIQHHQIPGTFHWNGITSKKKGQKWGKEKPVFWKKEDDKNLNQESFEKQAAEEETPRNLSIDFNKLRPCTTMPEEGDLVAYRLIELSSSWTPELSPFRVGKLTQCNPASDKIVLMQVPEHPIVLEKYEDEESVAQPAASLYGEDGSLEIDYSSLADVRIIKHGNLNKTKTANGGRNEVIKRDKNPASDVRRPGNSVQAQSFKQENAKSISWDEISRALNAKKAQLSQGRQWGEGESSGTGEVVHWVSTWQ